MNKIFFTSDTHFGAERTLKLSRRPFSSVEEMDNTIIENWNKTVGKNDLVFHLGDFGDYKRVKELNGKIYLIFGNYERKDLKDNFNNDSNEFMSYLFDLGFTDVCKYELFSYMINNNMFYMSHEPSSLPKIYNKDTDIHLFGHIHEKQMIKRFGLNVGVDCHNFKPVDIDTVLFYDNALKNFYDEEVFM